MHPCANASNDSGMHELGIAASILECVRRKPSAILAPTSPRSGLRLESCPASISDALQFGFEVLVKDTEFEPLVLELEFVPRMQRCSKCEYEFRMTDSTRDVRCAATSLHNASAGKNSTSPTWKWMNESHRRRKEGPEREPDPGRAAA